MAYSFEDENEILGAFNDALLENLKLELVRSVITVPYSKQDDGYDEYADYLNLSLKTAIPAARQLGASAATLYNSLIQNALRTRKHKVVTDILDHNLKMNFVVNSEPSIVDPAAQIRGWISFRFYFKSSNEMPASLNTKQTTLEKLSTQ